MSKKEAVDSEAYLSPPSPENDEPIPAKGQNKDVETKMSRWKVQNLRAEVDRQKIITKVRCLRFGHASRMTGNIAGEEFENIVARRRAKP